MRQLARCLASSWLASRKTATLAAALFALALPGLAQAQDSNAQFWLRERALQQREATTERPQRDVLYQRPTHLIRRAKPVRGFTLDRGAKPVPPAAEPDRTQEPAAAAPPNGEPAPLAAPGAPATNANQPASLPSALAAPSAPASPTGVAVAPTRVFTVAIIGDSLGEFLEEGLSDIYANRPDVVIMKRARDSTGLVRQDYFDWVQAADDLASGKDHIDMAIMMIGSNDHQQLRTSSGVYDPLTPKWREAYAARADAIAKAFHQKKIPFLWVGAPIMRSPSLSQAMLALNDIYKASVEQEGGLYLDDWDLFADDSGQYALYGPDVNGDTAKLRSSDGVHFTRAGASKLAQFVETEIKRVMDGSKPQIDQPIAGVPSQVAPAEPLAPTAAEGPSATASAGQRAGDLRSLIPAPAAPIQPVIPIRPTAGPVLALTAPVVAPDGQLVSRRLVQSSPQGESVEQNLSEGAPIEPRPGRADDFRWPHD